jgi:hypothetical protein
MARTLARIGDSVIAGTDQQGAQVGSSVAGGKTMVGIATPTELTGTCWLEASVDEGATWRRVQVYGIDIALPVNRFVILDGVPSKLLRAVSDVPEFDTRVFSFWSILSI